MKITELSDSWHNSGIRKSVDKACCAFRHTGFFLSIINTDWKKRYSLQGAVLGEEEKTF
jgi:hypothetical protein